MWTASQSSSLGGKSDKVQFNPSFKYYQISLLLELFPPVIVILFIVRISSSPSPWVWVVIVCHANISFWAWISYFVSTHSCGSHDRSRPTRGSSVFSTGIVFFTISGIICLIAALANDQYFPVARLTCREAKVKKWYLQPFVNVLIFTGVSRSSS